MFSKRSRYYRLNDTVHPDHNGVERNCKALRKLPDVDGRFLHTLEASDRLDHLAYKYYRQSLHWWRICDANPGFKTPLALLDKTPGIELKLAFHRDGDSPPLSELYGRLEQLAGVEFIDKSENGGQPETEIIEADSVLFNLPGALRTELDNAARMQVLPAALDTALQAEGLTLSGQLRFGRPGGALWQVTAGGGEQVYRFYYSGDTDLLAVVEATTRWSLTISVVYNRNSLFQQEIDNQFAATGFVIDEAIIQTRIGQSIMIPPRFTGKS